MDDASGLKLRGPEAVVKEEVILTSRQIMKTLAKPLKLMANILDSSLENLESNSLTKTEDEAGDVNQVTPSGPREDSAGLSKLPQSAWSLRNLCYTATLVAYLVAILAVSIVASRDAGESKGGKGKGKKSTRRALHRAPKFTFRNPIIFCSLGIVICTTSFNVWAQNHQVCVYTEP